MNACFSRCVLVSLVWVVAAWSTDYESQGEFFTELQGLLKTEYITCTHDSSAISFDSLIKWKEKINEQAKKPDFNRLMKEYIAHTGDIKDVTPCKVFRWHNDRIAYLSQQEDSIHKALISRADTAVDSARLLYELKKNPVSPFDFDRIPFGVSRKTFKHLFSSAYTYSLEDEGRYFCVEPFPLRDCAFIMKFYFSNNRFFKYEMEGYPVPAAVFETTLRMQASTLKDILEKKAGKPDNLFRLGYFDIKKDTLSPYAVWEDKLHIASIVIGMKEYKYFTKAIITTKSGADSPAAGGE